MGEVGADGVAVGDLSVEAADGGSRLGEPPSGLRRLQLIDRSAPHAPCPTRASPSERESHPDGCAVQWWLVESLEPSFASHPGTAQRSFLRHAVRDCPGMSSNLQRGGADPVWVRSEQDNEGPCHHWADLVCNCRSDGSRTSTAVPYRLLVKNFAPTDCRDHEVLSSTTPCLPPWADVHRGARLR